MRGHGSPVVAFQIHATNSIACQAGGNKTNLKSETLE